MDQLAFVSVLKDLQFLAEAEKAKLEIDPIDGAGHRKWGVDYVKSSQPR